jgi:exodeoxyribonuclease III
MRAQYTGPDPDPVHPPPTVLRIVTLNLNGIRSACRRGFLDWIHAQRADVVCVQEVKAHEADLEEAMRAPGGARGHFHLAQRKGYSGVGLYSRFAPQAVRTGFGCNEFDCEGRYVEADFGRFTVVSVYVPSGSSSAERQAAKFRFMDRFDAHLRTLRASGREIVLCGDWNIAHKEIDLRNWKANRNNSGFLPQERAWLTRVFDGHGYVDVFRRVDPRADRYTWWSNRGQAWAKNVGWRLDYQIATPAIAAKAVSADIFTARRFSDHAPLTIDYALDP